MLLLFAAIPQFASSVESSNNNNNTVVNANTTTSTAHCITYDPSSRLLSIACGSVNLTDLYNSLKKPQQAIIKEEQQQKPSSSSMKVWILNANLVIENAATLFINTTDTSWLKINSTTGDAYHIQAKGNLIIDSSKITSWDTNKNNYGKARVGDSIIPRSYIVVKDGTGMTNITNSEIAYLGYPHVDSFGLTYYTGAGSIIKNNKIHDLWYGFYSTGEYAYNITIQNNDFYRNNIYGLDPKSGAHGLIISNNRVFENGKFGIICSVDCRNIVIEDNKVYNNDGGGIMLHRNMSNSFIRNNIIYDNKEDQILIQDSSYHNEIYGNNIKGGKYGIRVTQESEKNNIHNNAIANSLNYGIYVLGGASDNVFTSNTISNALGYALYIRDPNTNNNTFKNNLLLKSEEQQQPIRISNLGDSRAIIYNNTMLTTLSHGGFNISSTSLIILIIAIVLIIIGLSLYLRRRRLHKS